MYWGDMTPSTTHTNISMDTSFKITAIRIEKMSYLNFWLLSQESSQIKVLM